MIIMATTTRPPMAPPTEMATALLPLLCPTLPTTRGGARDVVVEFSNEKVMGEISDSQ